MAREVLNDSDFPPGSLPSDGWVPWVKPDGTRGKTAGSGVGGGGGGILVPEIVHEYSQRGNGNQTISITTPTAGNVFLAVMTGFNATFTFPSGFDVLYSEALVSNQRIAIGVKECDGSETSLTFTRSADVLNVSVVELDGLDAYQFHGGGNAGTAGTFSRLQFAPGWGKTGMTVFAAEYDGTGLLDLTNTDGLLLEHPHYNGSTNHAGVVGYWDESERARKITGTNSTPSGSWPIQFAVFSVGKAP